MEKRKVLRQRSIDKEAEKAKRRKTLLNTLSKILKKGSEGLTAEEAELIEENDQIVQDLRARQNRGIEQRDRIKETEDDLHLLKKKCAKLAEAIHRSKRLVVYTGAGISTSANIPDYRGPQGVWTLLDQGKEVAACDLGLAQPTTAHMALFMLHRAGKISHIVSQNCDGLHLRSGIPRNKLSEVHGNMFIEVCKTCKPVRPYVRLFDVTERTNRFRHSTRRRCYICGSGLIDTIVHFGERGSIAWPINWNGASRAAEKADMILCLGSSLKVLRRYPWLWCMDRPVKQRPPLYIVNLQWTPKDAAATLKLNGRCDFVLNEVLKHLRMRLPEYTPYNDPLLSYATHLNEKEEHTTSRRTLIESRPVGVKHISMEARVADNGLIKEVRCETRFSTPSDNFRGRSSSTEEDEPHPSLPPSPSSHPPTPSSPPPLVSAKPASSSSSSSSSDSNSSSSESKSSSNSSSNASSRNSSSDRSGNNSDRVSLVNGDGSSQSTCSVTVNGATVNGNGSHGDVKNGSISSGSSSPDGTVGRNGVMEYVSLNTALNGFLESTVNGPKESHVNGTSTAKPKGPGSLVTINGFIPAPMPLSFQAGGLSRLHASVTEISGYPTDPTAQLELNCGIKQEKNVIGLQRTELVTTSNPEKSALDNFVKQEEPEEETVVLSQIQSLAKFAESQSCDIKGEDEEFEEDGEEEGRNTGNDSKEMSPFPSPDHTYAISPHKLEKDAIPNILEYVQAKEETDENVETPKNRRYGLREKRVQKYSKFDEEYFIQCQEQILKAVNTKKEKEEKETSRQGRNFRTSTDTKQALPKGKIKEIEYRTIEWGKDALYFSYEPNFLFLDDENEGFVCECCDPGTRLEGSLDKKAASSSEDNSEVDQETPEDDESCPEEREQAVVEEEKPQAPGWFGKGRRRRKARTKFRV